MRSELQALLGNYLAAHACVDCGESDVRVLDFDHRPGSPKLANVAEMIASKCAWPVMEAEISKCDVRCANCHRRATCERGAFWRQTTHEVLSRERGAQTLERLLSLRPQAG